MNDALVVIENITKIFDKEGQKALDNINAAIPKGEIVGLAGPDGAGKTTLIRLIAGLLMPSQGTITVAGRDTIKDAEQIHNFIGYMPQKFGLYEDLTVLQNLNLYADLQGVVGEEKEKVFKKLLAFTDLARFTERLAGALSGGMKQKLGLACALVRKPALLLLDEPTSALDPESSKNLLKTLKNLVNNGVSIALSTHDMTFSKNLLDKVYFMQDGHIVQELDALKQSLEDATIIKAFFSHDG